MAIFKGSSGTDFFVGLPFERNQFVNLGIGQDFAMGGQQDDTFFLAVDQLKDTIDGGGGFRDKIDYSAADRGVIVDLTAGHAWATWFQPTNVTIGASDLGTNGTVTTTVTVQQPYQVTIADISNIEDVTGSRFDDHITGTRGANILDGAKGNDTLYAAGGDDTLNGGEGNDRLFGGTGTNHMNGGLNDDTITLQFEGSTLAATRDTIDGGDGIDTVAFDTATVTALLGGDYGVKVMLDNGEGGEVASIQYDGAFTRIRIEGSITGLENVNGTGEDDLIWGNDADNVLRGNSGADVLTGGRGADTLYGDAGRDLFYESDDGVTDTIYGGTNTDTVTYETSGHGVRVTLGEPGSAGSANMIYSTSTSTGVQLHTVLEDTLYDIENVTGSDFTDNLTGNNGRNVLIGGWGNDTLIGNGDNDILEGGRDHDTLTGGADSDTFRFSIMGETGNSADLITDFQTGIDHIDFSPFYSHADEFHLFHSNDLPTPTFLGSGAFSGNGNEVRIFGNANGEIVVQLDLPTEESNGGTGIVDVEIVVHGTTPVFQDFLF